MGRPDALVLKALQPFLQHRAVSFLEDVEPKVHATIRPDAQDIRVKCGMVQLAQGQPILDNRFSARVAIRQDVRCVEQFLVPQMADGTVLSVCPENALPEDHLMDTLSRLPRHVPSSDFGFGIIDCIRNRSPELLVINCDSERQPGRIIGNYEYGPRGDVQPGDNTVEYTSGARAAIAARRPRFS